MADPAQIYQWRRLDHRVTTSGQPSEAELAALQAIGVAHVINLAPHDHAKALPDEAASVQKLGMNYIHIPVDFSRPTDADFARFCSVMADLSDAPVHVHCGANYRVSAFFYRYRREVLGMEHAPAWEDLSQVWQPDAVWSSFIGRS